MEENFQMGPRGHLRHLTVTQDTQQSLGNPHRKKYWLLRGKYFREDSRIRYLCSKYLNMRIEWENIKDCNKYPCEILNIHGGQLMMNP